MMKKIVFATVVAVALFVGCSKDDDKPKCEECTSDLGNKFKFCDNGNGTYDAFMNGEKEATLTEEELLGLTIKEAVKLSCDLDSENDLPL